MKSPMVTNANYIDDKDRYSDLQVMKSAAGYYLGTVYHNPDGYDEPGSRDSHYFDSKEEAEEYLEAVKEDDSLASTLRRYP